jgi:hypothetical protein
MSNDFNGEAEEGCQIIAPVFAVQFYSRSPRTFALPMYSTVL